MVLGGYVDERFRVSQAEDGRKMMQKKSRTPDEKCGFSTL